MANDEPIPDTYALEIDKLRLYDNTRLSDFRRCPRFFFFRHIMGWVMSGERRAPLVFGGAWHAAMDILWGSVAEGETRKQTLASSYAAFVAYWTENGMPHPSEIDLALAEEMSPRTPMNAKEMLEGYYDKRFRSIREVEILEIERPFAVPLTPDDPTLFYIGRIDKVVKPSPSSVRGIEHKTTTSMRLQNKVHKISGLFAESFSPNSQVDGYLYALHLLFPEEKGVDVWVDAALVHKVGEDFMFIPVDRQIQHLDSWLWEVHYWVDSIERQKENLATASSEDRYLAAFPKDTRSCFDFNTACPYLGLCKARSNPLTWGAEAPGGYKEEKWDPLSHIGTPKELVG